LIIQQWFDTRGDVFILSVKEFCQGNRASLAQVMAMVEELSARVFKREGKVVNIELLEDLEYGIFDLIGKFTSTPGDELLKAIQENIVEHLTELFAKTKKQWNLNHYKITTSFDELDPCHSLIPDSRTINNDKYDSVPMPKTVFAAKRKGISLLIGLRIPKRLGIFVGYPPLQEQALAVPR